LSSITSNKCKQGNDAVIDQHLLRLWRAKLIQRPDAERVDWLVTWLLAGITDTCQLAPDSLAFTPFDAYVAEPSEIAPLIKTLLHSVMKDPLLTDLLRQALAKLPSRLSFNNGRDELVVVETLTLLGRTGISEVIPRILLEKKDQLYSCSDKVILAVINMAREFASDGEHLLQALGGGAIPPSQRSRWRSFVFVLVTAQLLLSSAMKPRAQEHYIKALLRRHEAALRSCSEALDARRQLTEAVMAHLPRPVSKPMVRFLHSLNSRSEQLLDHEVLARTLGRSLHEAERRVFGDMAESLGFEPKKADSRPRKVVAAETV
jgi:hypothetical protein